MTNSMNLTDKEILDFVKANMTFGKNFHGILQIKEVNCSIHGNVKGNTRSICGNVYGDIEGSILGDVKSNVSGDVCGDVIGNVEGNVYGTSRRRGAKYSIEMRGNAEGKNNE